MQTPFISFVVPIHNAGAYLPAALASLRWQSFTDWEAICVDDGSTDGSGEVIERFVRADSRFHLVRQPQSGLVAALNTGLQNARGPWIARMDGDDISLPDRLERQIAYAEKNPQCIAFGGAVRLIDPDGDSIGPVVYPTDHEAIKNNLLSAQGATIAHPTLMARREAIEVAGRYRHEFESVQDADLLLRLAQVGPLANLPDEVLLYRQHPKNYCRVNHAVIQQDMMRLIQRAHTDRGSTPSSKTMAKLQRAPRQTALVGKWARKAARSGYLGAAYKLTVRLLIDSPMSLYTLRVVIEVALRSLIAVGAGRRGARIDLPDWREWDGQANPSRQAA